MVDREAASSLVELPSSHAPPLARILWRLALALGLILFVAVLAYIGRDGYVDAAGDGVSFLDALYYATVSVTTTGYGDVRPESDTARLVTTVLVTPARVLFLIVLVGTTLEVLAEHTRDRMRVARWRARVKDHIVVCGYGTKGRSATHALISRGESPDRIVVIDERPEARRQAEQDGLASVAGDASRSHVLAAAEVQLARSVIVAPARDDTAVLITLTARELNPQATIVAAVREEENAHLLRQSGADSVIVSSGAAGRMLGLATATPRLAHVLEDLLTVGEGLDLVEREIGPDEAGPLDHVRAGGPVVAVVRDGEMFRFDDPRARELRPGDRVVYFHSHSS